MWFQGVDQICGGVDVDPRILVITAVNGFLACSKPDNNSPMPMTGTPAKILYPGRFVMRVRARAALCLILASLWLAGGGYAVAQTGAADDVFTVAGVAIDETAESAAAARAIALEAGQKIAYRRLLDRLVPRNAHRDVPEPTSQLLADIVAGIAVDAEKTSPVRYLAELTVRFNADAVRRRFRDAGIRWAETRSKPLVVLPVYRAQGTLQLWDRTNLWHKAWLDLPDSDGLIRLVVPPGETSDIADISPAQALAGDDSRIAALAGHYGAEGALLAAATLQTGDRANSGLLEVAVSRFGPGGADQTSVRSYGGASGTSIEALLASAAQQLRRDVEERWKQDNLLRFGERQELVAVTPVNGLPALIRLRRDLASVAEIQAVDLVSITLDRARIRLLYLGDPSQLVFALAQKDIALTRGPVDWQLARKGTP
tara:strand:+ start:1163 stop:2446 length:1284 start_codon:yes stop_codon:yes gene_type:complete